jgi:hypothetical protein
VSGRRSGFPAADRAAGLTGAPGVAVDGAATGTTTVRLPKAESPRTRMVPVIPAITGAPPWVPIVVTNGKSPLHRTCLPAIFKYP